jgi:hypothetical protein
MHAGATEPSIRDAPASHLAVLASVPAKVLLEVVQPQLTGGQNGPGANARCVRRAPSSSRVATAALVGRSAGLFDRRRRAGVRAVERTAAARGWDPGAGVIEAALADSDPAVLTAGLRLLPRSDQVARLRPRLSMHMYATHPPVRIQAIESAVTLGDQSA